MSNRPRIGGLGRGLGALIPTAPVELQPEAGPQLDDGRAPDADAATAGASVAAPPGSAPSDAGAATGPDLVPVNGARFA